MRGISLKGSRPASEPAGQVNGHVPEHAERPPLAPWTNEPGVREIRQYKVSPKGQGGGDKLPGRLLGFAGAVIFAALVGSGFVAYEAQRLFALAHNHTGAAINDADQWRAAIVGALPDAGWIAMALVALVAALRGQSSLRARVGVLIFFGLSLGAQVLYAPGTVEGILVAVIAPITMAWMLETFIVEVRRWAGQRRGLEMDESPILSGVLVAIVRTLRGLIRLLMWVIRLVLAPKSTASGLRSWILDTAPIAPGRSLASMRAAEALAIAEGATTSAEQVREQAADEIREITEAAAAERTALTARLTERESEMTAELRKLRRELDERMRAAEHDRELLIAERDLVLASASARDRLIARYERLRLVGDGRYGDRSAVPAIARELYEEVGLQRDSTARNYLHEHLDTLGVPPKGQEAAE
ncbi:hypothetical protein Pth03_78040 [Planotetraspora thailandica]|uniref:DUF2637 domain-containing protein n=1 Tax=Planotetraspora thailandica TaxID=487172 RepID=A0A8J4DFN3_9ACTN|nr:DUF2637 domain-containing protein [Planotetraspora thailandica]GII59415.1 hypothetical protein Pth03_78040 [Planotetraspora thailandica]